MNRRELLAMGTGRPRVLLVEDDTAIRQWVEMALEDEPVALLQCRDVDAAVQELRRAPVHVLITDLMLPGRSGYQLLEQLVADPELRAGASLVAFSAGMNTAARARLAALGVHRCVSKPASLGELLECLHDCLREQGLAAPGMGGQGLAGTAAASPRAAPDGTKPADDAARQALALARHFGGNARLYAVFESSSARLLHEDLEHCSSALSSGDHASLRLQAHSLKSVLRTLALDDLADLAQAMERAAQARDSDASAAAWEPLARGLQRWLAERAGAGADSGEGGIAPSGGRVPDA